MRISTLRAVVVGLFLIASPVFGQTNKPASTQPTPNGDSPLQRVIALEKEVQALRAEAARLRQQIAAGKPTTSPAADIGINPPPKAKQAEQLPSVLDLLAKMPDELKPSKKEGWERVFTMPKVKDWLDSNLVGQRIEFTGQLSSPLSADYSPKYDPTRPWTFGFPLDSQRSQFRGQLLKIEFVCGIACDEATAKKWDKTPKGRRLILRGVIRLADFDSNASSSKLSLSFEEAELVGFAEPKP